MVALTPINQPCMINYRVATVGGARQLYNELRDVASWALGPSYVICSALGSVMEVTAVTLPCYAGR